MVANLVTTFVADILTFATIFNAIRSITGQRSIASSRPIAGTRPIADTGPIPGTRPITDARSVGRKISGARP
jgi:hypothetical protein